MSCEKKASKKGVFKRECLGLPLVIFSKNIGEPISDSLLLHEVLCELPTVKLDSPCCNRLGILSSIDKNYKTSLSKKVIYGADIDLFTDSVKDLFHFHKILELKLNSEKEALYNANLLSFAPKDKPAFKTENKGTLAWRLKSFTKKDKLYLVFSNIESDFDKVLANKLDSLIFSK